MIIPSPNDIRCELARRNLQDFIRLHWQDYRTAKHIDALVKKLEAVERGEIKRLIIDLPPRCSKSVHASEYLPPWFIGRDPSRQVIMTTYSGEFSEDWGGKVRDLIQSPITSAVFPDLIMKPGSKAKNHFTTTARGEYSAVGIGGAIVGRGANLFIVDDPVKNREEAESETIRAKIISWFKSTAYTRLMPGAAIIVMMTRWHCGDLVGWLLKEFPGVWDTLILPAIAEENDPLGREEGEALWPEMFPIETLNDIRATLGSYEFGAQYQQHPAPIEGGLFKINWFNRYGVMPSFPEAIVHSYDTGTKTGADNDPTAFGCWHAHSHGWYLKEVIRERIDHPSRKRMVINMAARDNPTVILIEEEGNGIALIQDLRADPQCAHLNVVGIPVKGKSKEVRAIAVTGVVESGRAYLPNVAPWLADFEHELKSFPNVEHDDQIDQMTQALSYMKDNGIGPKSHKDPDKPLDIPVAGRM